MNRSKKNLSWIPILAASILLPAGTAAQDAPMAVTERLVATAKALVESTAQPGGVERMMQFSRREALLHPFDAEAREDWSYWPRPRIGLELGRMDAGQRTMTQDFLSSVLSAKGYLKVFHIIYLEEILKVLDTGGVPRTTEGYVLAFFGEPSTTEPWSWRFEGHHVSLNFTVTAAGLRPTPTFLGANPARIPSGPLTGFRPLRYEEDLGREICLSLTEAQKAQAVLDGDPPSDVFSGNLRKAREMWQSWKETLQPEGVRVSTLDDGQQSLVRRLLVEVVTTYRAEIAHQFLDAIDLDKVHFAWIGSVDPNEPHYYRLQGEDFVYEYDGAIGGGNHAHSVWRDRSRDFGADLLQEHYQRDH